jgi:hypothetical protein
MIEAKKQIVQEVLKRYTGPVEEFEFVKAELLKMSLEELQQYAQLKSAAIKASEADERILELQAARAADRVIHELEMSQAREPQRKAEDKRQLAEDRKTFFEACRQFHIGNTDANFGLVRSSLGLGFSPYEIGQGLQSGELHVSPATPEEIQQWAREAEVQRQRTLRNMSPEDLRSVVRNEAESRRAQAQRERFEHHVAHREALDAQFGYPPLPERNYEGQAIDAAYLTRISNTNLDLFKRLIRKHGAAQITRALRERV